MRKRGQDEGNKKHIEYAYHTILPFYLLHLVFRTLSKMSTSHSNRRLPLADEFLHLKDTDEIGQIQN